MTIGALALPSVAAANNVVTMTVTGVTSTSNDIPGGSAATPFSFTFKYDPDLLPPSGTVAVYDICKVPNPPGADCAVQGAGLSATLSVGGLTVQPDFWRITVNNNWGVNPECGGGPVDAFDVQFFKAGAVDHSEMQFISCDTTFITSLAPPVALDLAKVNSTNFGRIVDPVTGQYGQGPAATTVIGPPASIPTLSEWGLIGMALLLCLIFAHSLRRRTTA